MFRVSCFVLREQQGVTLLLAVMILAGLTLVALAVGSFAIEELRASRAVVISEPAIAAAITGGEQGLWAIKRGAALATCPAQTSQILTNSTLANACKSYGKSTINLTGGVAYTFLLYDPDDINGDIDLLHCSPNQSTPCYQYLSITHVSGTNNVSVDIERLPPPEGNTAGLSPSSISVTPGSTQTINIAQVPANDEGRMKVTLTSSSNATVDLNTNRGMPSFPTIDAVGCGSKTTVTSCNPNNQEIFTRRINITVPQ